MINVCAIFSIHFLARENCANCGEDKKTKQKRQGNKTTIKEQQKNKTNSRPDNLSKTIQKNPIFLRLKFGFLSVYVKTHPQRTKRHINNEN